MQERVLKMVIVDDAEGVTANYRDIIGDQAQFDVKACFQGNEAAQTILTFRPEVVLADIDKFDNHDRVIQATRSVGAVLIWASSFKSTAFEDLPAVARVINKPFRSVDLKFTVRGELRKVDRPIYLQM